MKIEVHKIPPAEMYGLGITVGFEKDTTGNLEIVNFLIPCTKRLMLRERGVISVARNTAAKFML